MVRNTFSKLSQWIEAKSALGRLLVLVGAVVLLGVVGLAVATLQATIGALATQIITWAVLLFVLLIAFVVVRSFVGGRGNNSESEA